MGMAKRNYSKRSKKIEPAVQTLTFANISTPPGSASANYIDLSQVASLVNRRFYRQGINWAVAGFKVLSDGNPVALQMNKLPNTWVMSNAWEKGFRTWQKMNREALAETESIRPKFLDFKIYANASHHTAGYGANLLPQSGFGDVATPGEWESSKFVIPTSGATGGATDFEVIATGASFPGAGASGNNAVSLIEGYAASRGLPDVLDPNTPADADDVGPTATPENWLGSIFNEGTDQDKEVLADMITENNIAPYPFEGATVGGVTFADTQYPGGANQMVGLQVHDIEYVTGTTIGGTTRMKGGNFPCGLIEFAVVNNGDNESTLTLQIDLVPGSHRGYLCESMTEM
jgi:hypothetical protein